MPATVPFGNGHVAFSAKRDMVPPMTTLRALATTYYRPAVIPG
jgi:hypothetical protein